MGALRPLRDSPGQRVSDAESDDLVLAFARAYTLSEIFPVRHATVQEAIREVCGKALGHVELEVTVAGIRSGGRAIGDRHGYLRELSRDLRGVGVTALRVMPRLESEAVEAFLEALRRVRLTLDDSFEGALGALPGAAIQVAFNGSPLPAAPVWSEPEEWAGEAGEPAALQLEETVEDIDVEATGAFDLVSTSEVQHEAPEDHAEFGVELEESDSEDATADPFAYPTDASANGHHPTSAIELEDVVTDLVASGPLVEEQEPGDWRDAFGLEEAEPVAGDVSEPEWHRALSAADDESAGDEAATEFLEQLDAAWRASEGVEGESWSAPADDLSLADALGVDDPFKAPDPTDEVVSELDAAEVDASEGAWEDELPWDESATPMPWEDVGAFWSAPPEDEPNEPAAADGPDEEVEVEEELWSLLEADDLDNDDAQEPPAAEAAHELPDAARLAGDPYAAPVIRTETDLAQIAAFRQALADLSDMPVAPTPEEPLAASSHGSAATEPDAASGEVAWGAADALEEVDRPARVVEDVVAPVAELAPPVETVPQPSSPIPITALAPDVPAEEPVLEISRSLPNWSAAPEDEGVPFAPESFNSVAEMAEAFLGGPAGRRPTIRAAILDRADRLASGGDHDSVCDAVEVLLLGSELGADGPYDLARSLCRPPVIATLVRRLGEAKEPDERERALRLVGRLPDHIAPALANELSEVPPRAARRNFLDALFTMGEHAFNVSIPMLEDSRWFIVRNGVDILGEVGGPGTVDRLTPALAHPDARVRRAAVMAMAKIGGDDAGSRLLPVLEDPDAQVREAAAMAVGHLRVERAMRPLLAMLENEKSDDVQMIVLRSLGQIADPSAVPAIEKRALGSFFYRPATAVRIAAYRALGAMGTPHATELIRQAVDDKNPEVAAAARALVARL